LGLKGNIILLARTQISHFLVEYHFCEALKIIFLPKVSSELEGRAKEITAHPF
jgi:hypothetical protein